MRAVRGIVGGMVTVLTVLAALLVGAASAQAAAPTSTVAVGGLEYAATLTEGRFGGAARAPLAGLWSASVVHDPLRRGAAAPITDGSFTLRGRDRLVSGTFVDGRVTPLDAPGTCGNERFDVAGTLVLDGGGRGSFRVVLTHLRTTVRSVCRTYGATVVGSLRVPSRAVAV